MKIRINGYELEGEAGAIRELLGFNDCQQIKKNAENDENLKQSAEKQKVSKPKAEPKKKKAVDVGKIRALRNGNWTLEKIADEMRLSVPTIRKYLNEGGAA